MATIDRIEGLRIVIYSNDHRPAHIHALGPDREAVFLLNCPQGPPVLREAFGFRLRELNALSAELARRIDALCRSWRTIHERY